MGYRGMMVPDVGRKRGREEYASAYARPPPRPYGYAAVLHEPWCNGMCGGACTGGGKGAVAAYAPPPQPAYGGYAALPGSYPPPSARLPARYASFPVRGGGGGGPSHEELVSHVKTMQRSDPLFKEAWTDYCQMHAEGAKDPNRHSPEFLQRALHALGCPLGALPRMERPRPMERKRPRIERPPSDTEESPEKDQLAKRIKAYQRASIQNKDTWGMFCDDHAGGTRDPMKISVDLLLEACDSLHIPEDI